MDVKNKVSTRISNVVAMAWDIAGSYPDLNTHFLAHSDVLVAARVSQNNVRLSVGDFPSVSWLLHSCASPKRCSALKSRAYGDSFFLGVMLLIMRLGLGTIACLF